MIAPQRSPSFLAYTYESDEEEEEDEVCLSQLCGCQSDIIDDESERESPSHIDETSSLVLSMASGKRDEISAVRRNKKHSIHRISDGRWVVGITLLVLILVFCEYCFFIWRSGTSPTASHSPDITDAETNLFHAVDSMSSNTTVQFSTTEYGEVWLIRHGEKVPPSQVGYGGTAEEERNEKLRAMYELSPEGWDRANHLSSLVKQGDWPLFSALFASRPATLLEAQEAYPDFVRDSTGQSMVKREYQTLVPISEYLQTIRHDNSSKNVYTDNETFIRCQFTKCEIEEVALEIAKAAVESASALGGNRRNRYRTASSNNETGKAFGSSIVLVSWDHCSLPTLVVRGLGCHSSSTSNSKNNDHRQQEDPRCYRCWPDDRFGDVLKLNVSLTTTTTITSTSKNPLQSTKKKVPKASTDHTEIEKSISQDFKVSSTILAMTGEAYPVDQYHKKNSNPTNSNNNDYLSAGKNFSTLTPMSIEKSTPCVQSYCTSRPASKKLVRCSCWDE